MRQNAYRGFPEVRPWALSLGGRLYGANIWVEYRYYLYLSPHTVRPTLYWVWILFVVTLHQCSENFFIAAQITFSIAIEGPLHLKPLEQNGWQNESDAGNMQLPYNSPGGYLVHVLFSQCVYFPINGPGRSSGKPRYYPNLKWTMVLLRNKDQQPKNPLPSSPTPWTRHKWTASSLLHDTSTVKLALMQCECLTGKWTVIARIKLINRNWAADFTFSRKFCF